mmetsp:Transcript_2473/g.3597  ORF Transcript_2473/g.3597 Transcript_2473/m.3597 type:complete len:82 (+) Transcript_2473:235-480(+)
MMFGLCYMSQKINDKAIDLDGQPFCANCARTAMILKMLGKKTSQKKKSMQQIRAEQRDTMENGSKEYLLVDVRKSRVCLKR